MERHSKSRTTGLEDINGGELRFKEMLVEDYLEQSNLMAKVKSNYQYMKKLKRKIIDTEGKIELAG